MSRLLGFQPFDDIREKASSPDWRKLIWIAHKDQTPDRRPVDRAEESGGQFEVHHRGFVDDNGLDAVRHLSAEAFESQVLVEPSVPGEEGMHRQCGGVFRSTPDSVCCLPGGREHLYRCAYSICLTDGFEEGVYHRCLARARLPCNDTYGL